MKLSWITFLLALSISCLVASYILLPKVQIGNRATFSVQNEAIITSDTLSLPQIKDAKFERLTLKRDVIPGDTLGFILKDRYSSIRDSLSAFAKTGRIPANFSVLPAKFKAELSAMFSHPVETPQARETKSEHFILRGIERDYLEAEIMGAEDASTEIIGKINHLNDAGKGDSPMAKKLDVQLREKQAFISSSKLRLAAKEEINIPSKRIQTSQRPQLTTAQRDRILTLSAELPIDTQRVFAPIAGRYYRPDDGVGYIIASSARPDSSTAKRLEKGGSGYILRAEGHPILWGTAQRKDSAIQTERNSAKELNVQIK